MAILERTTASLGPLVALRTRSDVGPTTAVQINDVSFLMDGPVPVVAGPLDSGQTLTVESDDAERVTFFWTTTQLTGWFALLAPGLEIRADESRHAVARMTIVDTAPATPNTGPLTIRFEWTPVDGTPAVLSYGGTTMSPLPGAMTRWISVNRAGGAIGVTGDPGAVTVASHLSWRNSSPPNADDSDGAWRAVTGWRELYPAATPAVSFTATPNVDADADCRLVAFSHGGLSAPVYLTDDAAIVPSTAPVDKQKIPILDCPANAQSIDWGGIDGDFAVDVHSDGLTLALHTDLNVDHRSQALRVHQELGVPLHDAARANDAGADDAAAGSALTFDYRGFTCHINTKTANDPPLVLRTANADHRIELGPDAVAELTYPGLGDEPLRFNVTAFSIGDAGIEIDASVRDEPITLHGIATGFRFSMGEVRIREGEVLDFSLSGSGPMPPQLVGDAVADIAIRFSQQGEEEGPKRAVPVGAGATLVTQGSLLGIAVPFAYDLSSIGLGFIGEPGGRYDFFFTLTGTATFSPPDNLPDGDPLGLLDTATIDLDEAPLAGDLSELAKAMSFRIELAEPVSFEFLAAFTMEIEEIALYGQAEAFDDQPGVELAGQVKFAEGEGDKKRSAETRHRLVIGPPEPGLVVPRIQLKELGITIEKGEAFKLDAVVNFVDETDSAGVRQKGFTGQGSIEIQGLPSLAVAVGFMTIDRPADPESGAPAETLKAWFIAINVGKLTLRIPYVNIFLREVGLGFGYRYTLTAIAAADEAEGLADLLRALREASRTQGDLATMDAWQVALEPRGTDPRWTIALRALFTQLASPTSTPMRLDTKKEKNLPNIFLFDVLAAVRSDLTIFMAARIWLNTNYIDYIEDADGSIQGKPLLSGFAIVQPAHQRFLAQASSNPDGHTGSHPPFPDFLKEALRAVQVSATVLIEPNLVHAELGWPNGLRYGMKVAGVVDVSVEAGVIYRIAQVDNGGQDLVLGISYKARASLEFRRNIDLVVAGASIVASASASFGARFIAAAQLGTGSDALNVYGGLSVDLRVRVRINAWIGFSLGFVEIKKHFSMALELGFSASLEFGLLVDPHGTTIGFQGRGTLLVRAFGRRFEFGVAVAHRGDVVTLARKETARYMKLGLEAGDGPVSLNSTPAPADTTDEADTDAPIDTTDEGEHDGRDDAEPATVTPRLDAGRPDGGTVDTDPAADGSDVDIPTTPAVAADWRALAVPPVADDESGWTHIVLYPGEGPGFLPVPPGEGADVDDFVLTAESGAFDELERWDPSTGAFGAVDSDDPWRARWVDDDGEAGLADYVAATFIDGEDPPQLDDLANPDAQVTDGRVRHPAASDYEAAVRGTLDQFRRSPHFRPDPDSAYEQNLRTAFSPQTDVYVHPKVEQARQLRSMAVEQMIGDSRDWIDDNDAVNPAGSPVFLFGLVFRVKGGGWLNGSVSSDGSKPAVRLAQRIGPAGQLSAPVDVALFNRAETSFASTPPEFEHVTQFADAAMVAFDWELTWSLDDDIEHHLAHYEVHRRAMLDASDQVAVTTYKPADAIGHIGDGVIRLIRRRFEFVDNFDGETLDQIAAIPTAGRTYVYTITPVDVTGGRGRPITLVATRLPTSPPIAPTEVDITVVYEVPDDKLKLQAAAPDLTPLVPASFTVAWTEPSPPVDRPPTPITRRELVFRRRATLPIGSYGLDTATNAASSGDLPSSGARLRRDDIVIEVTPAKNNHGGRRRQATVTVDALRSIGVLPEAKAVWQPDAWQVFVRTVSEAEVPSALVMAKVLLRFLADPGGQTAQPGTPVPVEDRQPAELEWLTPPTRFEPLPVPDTLARSGSLHVPQPTADGDQFREDPDGTRLVRVRWNQVRSGDGATTAGLTAGYHVFRLDVDAHTVATFESPKRLAEAARLLDEVRLQRPDAVALEPADTTTPGLWRTFTTAPPSTRFPENKILGWPGWSVEPRPDVEAILHPTLQALVAEVRAENDDVIVGLQQGRPMVENGSDEFLTTFGPGADPDGWALLQFLGLSVTISMRRRADNTPVDGASIEQRIAAIIPAVMSTLTAGAGDEGPILALIGQHLRIDRLYQPAAAAALEPGDVPPDARLAMVQISLRPLLLDDDADPVGEAFTADHRLVSLQALVDRATTKTDAIDVSGVPDSFLTRFVPPPIAADRLHGEATAIPRSSAPTRIVPDAQGRVHYDDRISDGYAHAYRYYVRPYGRYDRLWSGLVQSPTFRHRIDENPELSSLNYSVDRPLDVTDDSGAIGPYGVDAAVDRVAPLAPPVILSSSRVDAPPATDGGPIEPGPTWEIVLSGHREQWLSEQNRTVARRLDYRQLLFTVLRTFRFAGEVAAVDWTATDLRLPDRVALDLPALPSVIDEIDLATADSQTRTELDVVRRVGEAAKQAEIIQLSSLPFYYEHEFAAVAQSSYVVSDVASVRHREFGYRSPTPQGTATAQAVGAGARRTVTVALARLWDSLTEDSQTRWPGEDPDQEDGGTGDEADPATSLVSALPDPGVAYDVLFSRAGTVQPVAAIVFNPPSEGLEPDEAWEVQPIGDAFRVARSERFVTPHSDRLIGIAMDIAYVGEPFEPSSDQPVPEVPINLPMKNLGSVRNMSVPTMLVGLSAIAPFESTTDDAPAVTDAYATLRSLDAAVQRPVGELLWTPLDPTRPLPAIPYLVADVEEPKDYAWLYLTDNLTDEHRALLVSQRNLTDPGDGDEVQVEEGDDGWEAAVIRLCAALKEQRRIQLLPSLADLIPKSVQRDGLELRWTPKGPVETVGDELEVWRKAVKAASVTADARMSDPDIAARVPAAVFAGYLAAAGSMEATIRALAGSQARTATIDPEHEPWYRRRDNESLSTWVEIDEDRLYVDLDDSADTHSQRADSDLIDPDLALALRAMTQPWGSGVATTYSGPIPPSRPDPTLPLPDIPSLVADLDERPKDYARLHLTDNLSDDHRAILVGLRNQTDPVDGVDGWEAAVTRLCAELKEQRRVLLLPSLADLIPASVQRDGLELRWTPEGSADTAFDELNEWRTALETAVSRGDALMSDPDVAERVPGDVIQAYLTAHDSMQTTIESFAGAQPDDDGGWPAMVTTIDPEHEPWYRRRDTETVAGWVEIEDDWLYVDLDESADTHNQRADSDLVDPDLALALRAMAQPWGLGVATTFTGPILPTARDERLTVHRLKAIGVVTTSDRDAASDTITSWGNDAKQADIDQVAIAALYQRALWFDLAGGELQLRTRRGSAPPTEPVYFTAADPTTPIERTNLGGQTNRTEEDSNE